MVIPGSEYLVKILHAISQSLLIPGIIVLFFFLVMTCFQVGSFVAEIKERRSKKTVKTAEVLGETGHARPWQIQELKQLIAERIISPELKKSLSLLDSRELSVEERKLVAQDILERQEMLANKKLEKTDLIARLGPLLGLMLTLIPLGPGLAALGQGDVHALAQAIIVAFDATVVGIATGGTGFFLSKIRRRWYDQELNTLELLLNVILGRESHAGQTEEENVAGGRS
ncbi:MAG: MotA/TolQ/ExbB proton channel family protein [Armatimonadetes bacterium]|nr:MotA/TolQ/ExbB proton channel family protein [Armatimonadota bacterium]